jgi:hypothetical protein
MASSDERPSLLKPANTLKKLTVSPYDTTVTEYRLNGQPKSLKTFLDLFKLDTSSGLYDGQRFIWTSDCAFVCMGIPRLPSHWLRPQLLEEMNGYVHARFRVHLAHPSGPSLTVSIFAATLEAARTCLGFLVGLPDTHFTAMNFWHGVEVRESESTTLLPLDNHDLIELLRNTDRQNSFNRLVFTPDQSRALATRGTNTNLGFTRCRFPDGGAAFVDSFAENPERGPSKLSILGHLFDGENLLKFLKKLQSKIQSINTLTLAFMNLNQESCRAVVKADIQDLELMSCQFEDNGVALVRSVLAGRGPRGLSFTQGNAFQRNRGTLPFQTKAAWISLMNALRGSANYLERLAISGIPLGDEVLRALSNSLLENQGLVKLTLIHIEMSSSRWSAIFEALSTHPSIRTLKFARITGPESYSDQDLREEAKRQRTNAVVKMLAVNQQVEEMDFDSVTYNRSDWDANVAPQLECNHYRKKFTAIRKIGVMSTRASVMGAAMARVGANPSLLWMLLSQNRDIVVGRGRLTCV